MQVEEFVSPKSMITPTVAGAAATVISAALFTNLRVQPGISLLLMSFLLATIVAYSKEFKSPKLPAWLKVVLYVLNALLIFANATGTNAVLANRVEGSVSLFVQTVYAQSTQAQIKQSRPTFYDWTKEGKDPLPAAARHSNGVAQLTYESQRISKGSLTNTLTNAGILVPDYKVQIQVAPSSDEKVKAVTYFFPKEFGISPVTKRPGEKVELEAWKSFVLSADIVLENGDTRRVFLTVDPTKEKK
jgi:hypothetical protein